MQCVKMSKRCQVIKKMSNVKKKSNTWTMEEAKKIDIMKFTDIDVNFDVNFNVTYDGQ